MVLSSITAFRIWLFTFAICIASVVLCVAYVDRPTAEFFETHVRHTQLWHYLDQFQQPFLWVLVAAVLFLLGSGCWLIAGRRLSAWTRTPLLCSWSAVWGLAAESVFKGASGRSWPDPSYVQNHIYGFHFLLGNPYASAFPSGHSIISTAIATVLWMQSPRLRWPGVLLTAALLGVLIANNFHWVSDVIAGAFLGISIGLMTVRLQNPTSPTTH